MYTFIVILAIIFWISYFVISLYISNTLKNFKFFKVFENYPVVYKSMNNIFSIIFSIGLLIVPIYSFDIIDWFIQTNYINDHSGIQLPLRFWRDIRLSWH